MESLPPLILFYFIYSFFAFHFSFSSPLDGSEEEDIIDCSNESTSSFSPREYEKKEQNKEKGAEKETEKEAEKETEKDTSPQKQVGGEAENLSRGIESDAGKQSRKRRILDKFMYTTNNLTIEYDQDKDELCLSHSMSCDNEIAIVNELPESFNGVKRQRLLEVGRCG